MGFTKVGIIGAGQMGNGIAQVVASKNIAVLMVDVSTAALERGLATISSSLDRLIKKEVLKGDDKTRILQNISTATSITECKSCDLVIEAVNEDFNLKQKIFKQLDEVTSKHTILCSNTSSISVTKMAATTSRPHQFAGMHFMNPVPLMKLVEGIRGLQTSDDTFTKVKQFAEFLGKTWVESKDMPGFIVNRILMPMINEAVFTLHEGTGRAEDIDNAMKLGTNQPMGPLALADFIGLDTCLAIMNVLHQGLGESKYRPSPLLQKYVEAGWLGKKTGRGFYNYT